MRTIAKPSFVTSFFSLFGARNYARSISRDLDTSSLSSVTSNPWIRANIESQDVATKVRTLSLNCPPRPHDTSLCSAFDYWTQASTARFSALDTYLASFGRGCSTSTDFLRPVDEEISALKKVLSSLSVRRNRLSPVSRLPPEILARTFSFIASDELPGFDSRLRLGWIKVSHVCSRWRHVALDNSVLWATIAFDLGPQWVLSMVERARQVPLVVKHTHIKNVKDSDTVIDFLSSHLPIITDLELVVLNDALAEVMEEALSVPIPSLEHAPSTQSGTVDRKVIPRDALAHFNTPRLRAVTFIGCKVPWSSPIWHNMSHLKISVTPKQWNEFSDSAWLPSKDEFFNVLASMCHLESLSICNYFYQSPGGSASDGMRQPALELNQLSHLALEGLWAHCVVVLGSIRFPPTAVISLVCRESNHDFVNEVLVPMLERHSGKTEEAPPLLTLNIIKLHGRLTIEGWTTSDLSKIKLGSRSRQMTPTLSLSLHPIVSYRSEEGLHCTVLRALHIQAVSFLQFALAELDDREEHRDIFDLLESAQKLKIVTLQDHAFHLFCARLGAGRTRDGGILFPKLQQIVYKQLFSRSGIRHGEQILEWLKRRKGSQAPLRRLKLYVKDDESTRQWADKVGKIVPLELRWKTCGFI